MNAGYLPGTGGGANDNSAVVQAIYSVGSEHQRALAELVTAVKALKEENAELRREIRNSTTRSNVRAA